MIGKTNVSGGGSKLKRTLVGSVTSQKNPYTFTFDCTPIDGYEKLTADNFGIVPTSFYISWTNSAGEGTSTINSSMSYDANTGMLTITGTGHPVPRDNHLNYDVYCFHC